MPYVSQKQRSLFEGCRHDPRHMRGRCPDEKTLEKFHREEKAKGQKRALDGGKAR